MQRAVRLQGFLGRPAIVAAVAVTTPNDVSPRTGAEAPIVLSVKFIDDDVLADIASRLLLRNLLADDRDLSFANDGIVQIRFCGDQRAACGFDPAPGSRYGCFLLTGC